MIDSFTDEYAWLSNFYMGGGCLPSVEHQFQANKCVHVSEAIWVMSAPTPKKAKQRGRQVVLIPDWEDEKLEIMFDLVRMKFEDRELRERLLATGDEELIEGNWWGDTFWGVCKGEGKNALGKILMTVREEAREGGW